MVEASTIVANGKPRFKLGGQVQIKRSQGATSSHVAVPGVTAKFTQDSTDLVGVKAAAENRKGLGAVVDAIFAQA